MKHFLFILLITSQLPVSGQINIDTTAIRHKDLDETKDLYLFSDLHGLTPLAFSKNYLEIRVISIYMPLGGFSEQVITFNGNNWDGFKLEQSNRTYDSLTKTRILKKSKLVAKNGYSKFISKLEKADLFIIPSQNEIKLDNRISVFDGVSYAILYKVGAKFRCVRYNNPDVFQKEYPQIKNFKKFRKLIKLFSKNLIVE